MPADPELANSMSTGGLAVSVIIPTLNEEQNLRALLADLLAQQDLSLQLIVADGGSKDHTAEIASSAGAELAVGGAGRGRQMNAGRRRARHPWLLFLHADSRLCDAHLLAGALAHMQQMPAGSAGHFALRFDRLTADRARFYRHLEYKSGLNLRGTINGDQGLLIQATFFDQLGGFDQHLPFLEDQNLSDLIFAQGRWTLLPGHLHTSARRFEQEGYWQRYFLMMLIMCARRAGMENFLHEARGLYPQAADSKHLRVLPFLELILAQAGKHRGFWQEMGAYARENSWQLACAVDSVLGRSWLMPRLQVPGSRVTARRSDALLGHLLRQLFQGPIRLALRQQES